MPAHHKWLHENELLVNCACGIIICLQITNHRHVNVMNILLSIPFSFYLLVIKIQGHMLLSVYNLVARKRRFTVNVKHYHIKSHVGC